jgi:Putative endonuclease segE, GIY-YIG domain
MTEWLYQGKPIEPKDLEGIKSFVYIIVNKATGKKYIGKKRLTFVRRKKIKDSKRRKTFVKPSDWATYYGSSEILAKDIVIFGKENFERRILHLCESNALASYYELKEQIDQGVLFKPAEFYNHYVGARIHRNHVLKKVKEA